QDRIDRIFRPNSPHAAALKPNEPALLLLQKIRDEAHRFAVAFHSARRHKRGFASALHAIPGGGALRKRELLRAFGTRGRLAEASVDELAQVRGVDRRTAERVAEALRSSRAP